MFDESDENGSLSSDEIYLDSHDEDIEEKDMNESEVIDDEHTFNILLATDNHIGCWEKSSILRNDAINTFEEILQIAQKHRVDLLLLGGDLFHDNYPSRTSFFQTLTLLRKYCTGKRDHQIEIISKSNIANNRFSSDLTDHQRCLEEDYLLEMNEETKSNCKEYYKISKKEKSIIKETGRKVIGKELNVQKIGEVNNFTKNFDKHLRLISDELMKNINFHSSNQHISLPIFIIHGNHDDPSGINNLCSIDNLAMTGLLNYYGRCDNLQNIEVSPILLRKKSTIVALYGIGNIRDNYIYGLFQNHRVHFNRPHLEGKTDKIFSLLSVHQNRVRHTKAQYLPYEKIEDFFDLIFWGHEHDCRIDPEPIPGKKFCITQPGSSVATSLSIGESLKKFVGILKIRKGKWKLIKIPLKTVRNMLIDTICIPPEQFDVPQIKETCRSKVKEMIKESNEMHKRNNCKEQPKEPLIRLKVELFHRSLIFSNVQFGYEFINLVGNPQNLLQFSIKSKNDFTKDVETRKLYENDNVEEMKQFLKDKEVENEKEFEENELKNDSKFVYEKFKEYFNLLENKEISQSFNDENDGVREMKSLSVASITEFAESLEYFVDKKNRNVFDGFFKKSLDQFEKISLNDFNPSNDFHNSEYTKENVENIPTPKRKLKESHLVENHEQEKQGIVQGRQRPKRRKKEISLE
ncbi:hypothetical protein SNEBB_008306 [Seison nebaliae]|nr:hypothetical protein SNEBB_008306 [Seison nebaliae]